MYSIYRKKEKAETRDIQILVRDLSLSLIRNSLFLSSLLLRRRKKNNDDKGMRKINPLTKKHTEQVIVFPSYACLRVSPLLRMSDLCKNFLEMH